MESPEVSGQAKGQGLLASDWFDQPNDSCGTSGCGNDDSCRPIFDQRYLSIFGGFANIDNFEHINRLPTGNIIDGAGLRSGYAGGVALGGVVRQLVRTELEFTYRNNSAGSFFHQEYDDDGLLLVEDNDPATGSVNSYSGMYNVIFDVGKRCVGTPHLYLGGGLGSIYANGDFSTATDDYSIHDASFAYQFITGLNQPISQAVDLYTEYRYLGADNLKVVNDTAGVSMGAFTYDSHNVLFGVRFRR